MLGKMWPQRGPEGNPFRVQATPLHPLHITSVCATRADNDKCAQEIANYIISCLYFMTLRDTEKVIVVITGLTLLFTCCVTSSKFIQQILLSIYYTVLLGERHRRMSTAGGGRATGVCTISRHCKVKYHRQQTGKS